MKIAIIGYGKMGKAIDRLSDAADEVVLKIGKYNTQDLTKDALEKCDVAIEFSTPETAFENIKFCLEAGVPVISGTTGWLDKKEEIESICKKNNGTFFYASNFSVGVNLFFALNKQLAKLMNSFPQYKIDLTETHHIHKVDAPSGTAITIAEGILNNHDSYDDWALAPSNKEKLSINAIREGEIPGTHEVHFESGMDKISIRHEAFTRDSFAQGALVAARWVIGKKGILTMDDLMQLS